MGRKNDFNGRLKSIPGLSLPIEKNNISVARKRGGLFLCGLVWNPEERRGFTSIVKDAKNKGRCIHKHNWVKEGAGRCR